MRTRYTFDKVEVKGVRRWTENGKRRQQTRTFTQTINPFNVTADGTRKNREMIMKELLAARDAWLKEARTS